MVDITNIINWDRWIDARNKINQNFSNLKNTTESVQSISDWLQLTINKTPTISVTNKDVKWWLLNWNFEFWNWSQSSNGWIWNEQYWWYAQQRNWTATFSVNYDSTIWYNSNKSIKLSMSWVSNNITTSEICNCPSSNYQIKNLIPIKPNTKYRVKFMRKWLSLTNLYWRWLRWQIVEINSNLVETGWYAITPYYNWSFDWTQEILYFTSWANGYYLFLTIYIMWENGSAWVDNIEFEEIVEIQTDNLVIDTPSLTAFTSKGSIDNVDQSQLVVNSVWWSAEKFAQSFIPTKTKLASIILQFSSGHTASNNVSFSIVNDNAWTPWSSIYATNTISATTFNSILNDTDYSIPLPCILVPGTTYWIIVEHTLSVISPLKINTNSSWWYSNGTAKYFTTSWGWNARDWRDFYFKTQYYKPQTAFKASQNNQNIELFSDSDWFLNWAIIDFINWTFNYRRISWDENSLSYSINSFDIYDCKTYWIVWKIWQYTSNMLYLQSINDYVIFKINTWLSLKNLDINLQILSDNTLGNATIQILYSFDWNIYTVLNSITWLNNWTSDWWKSLSSTLSTKNSQSIYIKILVTSLSAWWIYLSCSQTTDKYFLRWNLDISNLDILYNKPTNKDIYQVYVKTLTRATTTATYRTTKYWFPAIEFSDWEYVFLDTNTINANYLKLSSDWNTYTILTDWQNISFNSTTIPIIYSNYKIPYNLLYISSNDRNNNSSKDWSLITNISYMWLTEWLLYTIQRLQSKINDLSNIDWAWNDYIPTITWDWSMTISNIVIWFAKYKIIWKTVFVMGRLQFDLWWTLSNRVFFSLPIFPSIKQMWNNITVTRIVDWGTVKLWFTCDTAEWYNVWVYKYDLSNFASGTCYIMRTWFFEII